MHSKCLLLMLILLPAAVVQGQEVKTYPVKLLDGPDGMVVDGNNNIYVANWGKGSRGSTVIKIDANGNESIYLDNLSSPDGLVFDAVGNLFVSCFANGTIIKVSKSGKRHAFASGLNAPSDLKFDARGNLFVSAFGNYNGTQVLRFSPDGKKSVFADSLQVPLGLAFDKSQNLYVSCFGSGTIYRVDARGRKTVYAQLPNQPAGYHQYLAFDDAGNLYCPSYAHNCIYRIDRSGAVTKLSPKDQQGAPLALSGPNSIFISKDVLYFTEFNTGRLRSMKLTHQ